MKTNLFFLLCFLICSSIQGQKFEVSIYASGNFSKLNINNSIFPAYEPPTAPTTSTGATTTSVSLGENVYREIKSGFGYEGGIRIKWLLTQKIGISSGLGYQAYSFTQKNKTRHRIFNSIIFNTSEVTYEIAQRTGYFTIPLDLNYKLTSRVTLKGGIFLAALGYASSEIKNKEYGEEIAETWEDLFPNTPTGTIWGQTILRDDFGNPIVSTGGNVISNPDTPKDSRYFEHAMSGLSAGVEFKINKQFSINAGYTRFLNNIFSSTTDEVYSYDSATQTSAQRISYLNSFSVGVIYQINRIKKQQS